MTVWKAMLLVFRDLSGAIGNGRLGGCAAPAEAERLGP
jgi:hypothetical protein